MKTLALSVVTIFMIFLVVGCAGGRMMVTAPNVEKVVSTTEGIYDKNYNILNNIDYEVVNAFTFNVSKWSIFWTLIPISSDVDISEQLNKELQDNNGDAIVNLEVEANTSLNGGPFINLFASIVPIIPSVVSAQVRGEVIKVKK